jgi:hypothetical protein
LVLHREDGSKNDNVSANTAALLAEVEELRRRLAALEERLPENPLEQSPGQQEKPGTSTKTAVRLTTGAMLTMLAGASLVYAPGAVKAAADALFIREGKVGIGTATPAVLLDVGGGLLHVAANVGTAPTVTSQGAYLGWNALTGGMGETDFINNQGGGSGGFAFMNTPPSGEPRTTLMVISGAGNVGIGKPIPADKLDVGGSATMTGLNVAGTATMTGLNVTGSSSSIAGLNVTGDAFFKQIYTDQTKPDEGVKIQGANGRNMFIDAEKAGLLRVGGAWGIPGIYSEKGDVVVGSQSGNIIGEVVYQKDDNPQTLYLKPLSRYHMTLTAANYAGRTKTIPQKVLKDLCSTPDGCEVRLGMTRWDNANKTQTASIVNRFYYSPADGHWRTNWPRDTEGVIGDGNTTHAMSAWDTCFFTDGTYENYQDKRDKGTGMQLLVWNKNNDPARTCELTIIP